MIIYNEMSLHNLEVQEQSEKVHDAGFLTELELKNIKEEFPTGFYTSNLIIRIGLFILTFVGASCAGSVLSLIFSPTKIIEHAGWPMILGFCSCAVLEVLTKSNRLFRAGIDDALIWLSATLLLGGMIWAISDHLDNLLISFFILVLSGYFTLRFTDTVMSVVCCLSFFATVFFAWSKVGAIGEATMPFVFMLVSAFTSYFLTLIYKEPTAVHYRRCLLYTQAVSLLMLYASGNYYVIQKLSNELHHLPQDQNDPLPFGWFFWIWTMLLPLIYIGWGLKKKSLMMLRIGLILVAAAAYTFRNYHPLMPLEYALVIVGAIILLAVFWVIRYLKIPKAGFTYAQRSSRHWANNVNLESLVVSGVASGTTSVPDHHASRFGGGSFGGGGSSADF
jgi:hypothetical protein